MFYSAQRLDLFAWCVRLSQLLVGFRTHLNHCTFISFHFIVVGAAAVIVVVVVIVVTWCLSSAAGELPVRRDVCQQTIYVPRAVMAAW